MYLVTAKQYNEVKKQIHMDEKDALNLARKSILALSSMEETSADLIAIGLLKKASDGTPQSICNEVNGFKIVFQKEEIN